MGAVSPWGFLIIAKKILIISHPLDLHAAAVSFSLKLAGPQVEIWYPSEFPAFQTVTYRIDAQEARLEIGEAEALHHAFDVIWNRRPGRAAGFLNIYRTCCRPPAGSILLQAGAGPNTSRCNSGSQGNADSGWHPP